MDRIKFVPNKKIASAKESNQLFNTLGHIESEISTKIPHIQHYGPSSQPWLLLSPFLSLVISSQNIPFEKFHEIFLPGPLLDFLLQAETPALTLGSIPDSIAEEIALLFPKKTSRNDKIEEMLNQASYFPRLDTCNLKDAVLASPGSSPTGPVKDVKDLWTRLASSARALRSIQDLHGDDDNTNNNNNNNPIRPLSLFLFPFREEIHPTLQYRCFCSPPRGDLVAISQYNGHQTWHYGTKSLLEQKKIVIKIIEYASKLHERIISRMTKEIEQRGFVFDVVEDPVTQQVTLLDLSDFGPRRGCESFLFDWVEDAEVLYGLKVDTEGVQFMVTA